MNSFNLFALISFWTIIAASCRSLPINSFRTLSSLNKKSSYPFEIPHGNHIVRIEIKKKNGNSNGYGVRSFQTLKGANGLKILIEQNKAVLEQSKILPFSIEDSTFPSLPEKTAVYDSIMPTLPVEEHELEVSTVSPLLPIDDSTLEDSTLPTSPVEEHELEVSTVSPLLPIDDSTLEDSTLPSLPVEEPEEPTPSPLQIEDSTLPILPIDYTTPIADHSASEDSTMPTLPVEEPELEESTLSPLTIEDSTLPMSPHEEYEQEKPDITIEDSTLPSSPVEENDDQEKDSVDSSKENNNEQNENVELTTAVQESSESEESGHEDENPDSEEDSHDDGHHDNLATQLNEEESPVVSSHNDEEYYDYNHETNSKENLKDSVYVYDNYENNHEPVKKASDGFFGSNQIALPQPKVAFENHMRTQDRFRGPEVQDSFYQNRFRSPVSRQKRPERLPAARVSTESVSSQFRPHPLRDAFATRLLQIYSPVLFG